MKRAAEACADGAHIHKRQKLVGGNSTLCEAFFTAVLHVANAQRSARRGLAYVWLHFLYEPLIYRRRVRAAHEFLARRSSSDLISDVEDAVQTAESKPFRALLREDFWDKQDFQIDCRDTLLERRAALRSEMELQLHRKLHQESMGSISLAVLLLSSCGSRLDPRHRHYFGKVPLEVDRGVAFDSAVEAILAARPSHLLSGVHVRFHEDGGLAEAGVDSGGLTREFFELVIKELVDSSELTDSSPSSPSRLRRSRSVEGIGEPMFRQQADGALMLAPSSRPPAVYFALGRLIGVSLVHASYGDSALPLPLSDCLLKCMVGAPITAADVRKRDPLYYKNRIEAVLTCEGRAMVTAALMEENLVFTERGRELKPGGASVVVSEENVREYVALLSEEYICGDVRTEISEFLAGFHDIAPRKLLQQVGLSFNELGNLLSGVERIDVEVWRKFAQVRRAGVSEEDALRVANSFWETLERWPLAERNAVLAFATGCSRLPACGFDQLDPPFAVEVTPRSGQLPTSHTCFNTITLPAYAADDLEKKLALAIHECSTGFALL